MQVTSHCGGHLVGGKPCASWWTASELHITKLREGPAGRHPASLRGGRAFAVGGPDLPVDR